MQTCLKFFVLLAVLSLSLVACKDDEPSVSDWLEGDWSVEVANVEGLNSAPSNMAFEFESDGEFDLEFVFNGTRFNMTGDWEVNDDGDELELTYNIQDFIFVGLGGFFLGKDISREDWDLTRDGDNDLELDTTVEGLDMELRLERD
jgi:hypothetical protein